MLTAVKLFSFLIHPCRAWEKIDQSYFRGLGLNCTRENQCQNVTVG